MELHYVNTNGKESVDKESYAGVYVEKFVFHKEGYEDSELRSPEHLRAQEARDMVILLSASKS